MSAKEAAKKRAIQSIKLNEKETKTSHSELDGRHVELLYNELNLVSSENGFYPSKDTEYTPKTSDFQGQEKAAFLPCRPVSRPIGSSSNNVTEKLSPIQNFLSEDEKIVDKLRYNFHSPKFDARFQTTNIFPF